VNPQGTGDFPTIQEALDAIWPGDTVELTDGTFTGEGNRDITFPGTSDITLRSQSGDPQACVIDCEADSTDPHSGLRFYTGVDSTAVVQGIMIRNAYAENVGGAAMCNHADPKFVDCRFDHNGSRSGGSGVYTSSSEASFTNCVFFGNSRAAMVALGSHHKLFGCVFTGNSDVNSGALYVSSGMTDAQLELTECEFSLNEAGAVGGALYFGGDSLRVSKCSFHSNNAVDRGGAIHTDAPYIYINRSTFAENSAAEGGGIYVHPGSRAIIANVIVAFSPEGEAVHCDTTCVMSVSCCDFYANAGGDWVGPLSGDYGVNGNISLDPYFCDLALGDLTIDIASPCAAANAPPGCGQIGYYGPACDQASVPGEDPGLVTCLSLGPAVPNPFGSSATIAYAVPQSSDYRRVVLKLYDVRGRCVKTLVDASVPPGMHSATWDGTDQAGRPAASGIYFHRLTWNGECITRRVVILR
jgi:predicted outer membrane repeat protein